MRSGILRLAAATLCFSMLLLPCAVKAYPAYVTKHKIGLDLPEGYILFEKGGSWTDADAIVLGYGPDYIKTTLDDYRIAFIVASDYALMLVENYPIEDIDFGSYSDKELFSIMRNGLINNGLIADVINEDIFKSSYARYFYYKLYAGTDDEVLMASTIVDGMSYVYYVYIMDASKSSVGEKDFQHMLKSAEYGASAADYAPTPIPTQTPTPKPTSSSSPHGGSFGSSSGSDGFNMAYAVACGVAALMAAAAIYLIRLNQSDKRKDRL